MAAQFGMWNFDGHRILPEYLDRVRPLLTPYGPEGSGEFSDDGVSLLWFSFESSETNPGKQPYILDSGEVLLWDGRLDNGPDILRALGRPQLDVSSDVEVVAAAWHQWGESCFARFVGDWSLSLWTPRDRRLLLAVDFLASRHLCYLVGNDGVQWSSIPDPLILSSEHVIALDEEYLAGWLGSFPAAHLTPFREIHRVPPASVVTIRPGSVVVRRFWDFDGSRKIRCAGDTEYEVHFLDLFRQSVRRRLRSNLPLLAELSGGMDSSAIVCVADQLTDASGATKIDTVSWYNDSEPHWNERPWFTGIEARRGQTGLHIDVRTMRSDPGDGDTCLRWRPGASIHRNPAVEFMRERGHRVLLSGIGGDEFLGGVPTPLPELEDLLARGRVVSLWHQLLAWALVQRRPWIHLFHDTVSSFLPDLPAKLSSRREIPWLLPEFARRQRRALGGYRSRLYWTGSLPSFQENTDALEGIRRQLGCMDLSPGYPFERRYPFLDRDLLEFLFAIPREQLVRPGQRRSLMRRALRGIVPDAILDRRRKAFVSQAPIQMAEQHLRRLAAPAHLASEEARILDPAKYRAALHGASTGEDTPLVPLLRTMALEQWLEAMGRSGMLNGRLPSSGSQFRIVQSGCNPIPELQESGEAMRCRL